MAQFDLRQKRILVVDDEINVRESLRLILSRVYEVDVCENGDDALAMLQRLGRDLSGANIAGQSGMPDLIILDVIMPGIDGIELLERLKVDFPSIAVIMLTASTTVRTAVQAMKVGAVDYLSKPFDVDELLSLVEETLRCGATGRVSPSSVVTSQMSRTNLASIEGDFGGLVGNAPSMKSLYAKVGQLASRDTTILITGESGTGKEVVAKEIHKRSNRARGLFVALNCAAIPETLIESELFGHERGAFTHAIDRRLGHFELADKGTLFLDEIGELSLPVQVKMLRFLQEKEFYRVGRSKPIQVDVRILAATNRSLDEAIAQGRFRQDLFYRINVVTLDMPPLRERPEDIPGLVEFFLQRLGPLYGARRPVFSEESLEILKSYSWPGNVRELENVTESILALSLADIIRPEDLPNRIKEKGKGPDLKDQVLDGELPFEEAERAFETDIILNALKRTNYVQTRAAEMLGISRRILKYKMDKLGLSDHSEEDS